MEKQMKAAVEEMRKSRQKKDAEDVGKQETLKEAEAFLKEL